MVSGTSHSDIKTEWVVSVRLVHFPSYLLPEGELYVGCSTPFARASFGGFQSCSSVLVGEGLVQRKPLPLGLGLWSPQCTELPGVCVTPHWTCHTHTPKKDLSPAQTSFYLGLFGFARIKAVKETFSLQIYREGSALLFGDEGFEALGESFPEGSSPFWAGQHVRVHRCSS